MKTILERAVEETKSILPALAALEPQMTRLAEAMMRAWDARGKVLVAGNGGSASERRYPWRRMNGRTLLVIAGALLLTSILLPGPMYVRQDLGWIDAVSGSRMDQTQWRVGPTTAPLVTPSRLEKRFRELGLTWTPDWRNVKGTYRDAWGRSVGHGHGAAPAIYTLAHHDDLQRGLIAASTDKELRELFRVLSGGTEAEQRAAVDAACDKALRAFESGAVAW